MQQQRSGDRGEQSPGMDFISQNAMVHRRSSGGGSSSGLVQPLGSFWSFAGVYVDRLLTVLTLHRTAPLELALALRDALDACRIVAPPTAHHLASVRPSG